MGIGESDTLPRLSPFAIAFDRHIRSQSTSPPTGSVRESNTRPGGISRSHKRSQPLIVPAQARQAQPTTSAICVEQERSFTVTHATPLAVPGTPEALGRTVLRSVPPAPERLQSYTGFTGSPE